MKAVIFHPSAEQELVDAAAYYEEQRPGLGLAYLEEVEHLFNPKGTAMRNVRRLTLTEDFIATYNLSTAPPPPDSLFWTMWNTWFNFAQQALGTNFIQGIKSGTLDPTVYGSFNVSDAYYCFNGAEDYLTAASHAKDRALKAFLLEKYASYEKYNATFPTTWHVRDGSSIVPTPVTKAYSDYEREVALRERSIYSLVCMIPCEYLWSWLASELSPPAPGNLYAPWITGNDDPSSAYAMGNFLDYFQKAYPNELNPARATEIYGNAMQFECQNFISADTQID